MTMLITPVIIPMSPPTHETVTRNYEDRAGRSIEVSVRAAVGQTDPAFKVLPKSWREVDSEIGPNGWMVLFFAGFIGPIFLGFVLFIGAQILHGAGFIRGPSFLVTDFVSGWYCLFLVFYLPVALAVSAWLIARSWRQ